MDHGTIFIHTARHISLSIASYPALSCACFVRRLTQPADPGLISDVPRHTPAPCALRRQRPPGSGNTTLHLNLTRIRGDHARRGRMTHPKAVAARGRATHSRLS